VDPQSSRLLQTSDKARSSSGKPIGLRLSVFLDPSASVLGMSLCSNEVRGNIRYSVRLNGMLVVGKSAFRCGMESSISAHSDTLLPHPMEWIISLGHGRSNEMKLLIVQTADPRARCPGAFHTNWRYSLQNPLVKRERGCPALTYSTSFGALHLSLDKAVELGSLCTRKMCHFRAGQSPQPTSNGIARRTFAKVRARVHTDR